MTLLAACVSLNQTPLDFKGNQERILRGLEKARQQGAQIIVFPELCISGYGCEDWFLAPDTSEKSLEVLKQIAKETEGCWVAVGLPLRVENTVYNCVATLSDGRVQAFIPKRVLAKTGVHYETRFFEPWPLGKRTFYKLPNQKIPLGDITVQAFDLRIGFEICEEAWTTPRIADLQLKHKVDIIVNPSASHFALGKQSLRRQLVLDIVEKSKVAYLYCNLLGNESGRIIYDGSNLIAQRDRWHESTRFSFEATHLLIAPLTFKVRSYQKERAKPVFPQSLSSFEEATYAICLGLRDYLTKSQARGFVLSLSGGADSSLVLCLVYLMSRISKITTPFKDLITVIYQRTAQSSEASLKAAESLCQSFGVPLHVWDIDDLIQLYQTKVTKTMQQTLSWQTQGLALENIQARVRAPGIWMMANIQEALLLTTSNRSECFTGYATMDGDTAGSLAPIAGLSKDFVLKMLKWLEATGIPELGPLKGLELVNKLSPSPELKPKWASQKTEDELLNFERLAYIEREIAADKHSPAQLLKDLEKKYPDVPSDILKTELRKALRLFSKSQWKRERFAPSFHLDEFNIDPRSGFRFPILSKAFTEE